MTVNPYFMKDADLIDLHRIFPNLTTFSPHGHLTGRYLDLWRNLKELNLSYFYKLELQQFHHIMQVLRLERVELNVFPISKQCEQLDLQQAQVEQLKYLHLNTYELYYFLSKPMPNLKDLILCNQYNPGQMFDVILATWPAKAICKIETANVENILANCLKMDMNVPEICIINDRNVLPANVIQLLHLLTSLRKLRLKNCKLDTVDIINLLKSVPQIDEISLEECRLDGNHIELKVMEITRARNKVLRLNFFANQTINLNNSTNCQNIKDSFVTVSLLGNDHLFELTQKQGSDLTFEPLHIHFR